MTQVAITIVGRVSSERVVYVRMMAVARKIMAVMA